MELKQEVLLETYAIELDSDNMFTEDVIRKNKGYKMTSISGYGTDTAEFAAIWDNKEMNDYTFTTDMTTAEFEKVYKNLKSNGFVVQCLTGYEIAGDVRYAAIWERIPGLDHKVQYGMNAADLYKWNADYTDQGYRPVRMSSYNYGDAPAYACIWVRDNGPETLMKHNLTLAALEECHAEYAEEGWFVSEMVGCRFNGEPTFSVIWEKGRKDATKFDVAIPAEALSHWVGEMAEEGMEPSRICGYPFNGNNYFAVVWKKERKPMQAA